MRGRTIRPQDIEELYRERFRAFVVSASAIVGDGETALEVVQDAFALAVRRRRSFRHEGSLEAWLWKIMLNVARDRRRALRREARPAEPASPAEPPSDSYHEVRASLASLPERQRLVVFLRYYADLAYADIADALGVTPGTVAASLNAAHRSLRQQLEEIPA